MAALLGRLAELRYVGAYRILDARHFGVPQRRRRVFIVALDADRGFTTERAAEVLSVGSRCRRHPPTGAETGPGTADGAGGSVDGAGVLRQSVNAKRAKGYSGPAGDEHHNLLVSPSPDPDRMRAPDGLAGRLDDRGGLAPTLTAPDVRHRVEGGKRQDGSRLDRIPVTLAPTLRVGPARPQDGGPGDTVPIIVNSLDQRRGGPDDNEAQAGHLIPGGTVTDDPLLPLGLDSHRYRCCGNGVVASVSEWIGRRLLDALA